MGYRKDRANGADGADSARSVRVALVDELDVVRAGVAAWLAEEAPAIEVVGQFARHDECLDWLAASPAVDALVTEVQSNGHAPDLAGLRRLCESVPAVIVYSQAGADEMVLAGLEAGATAYVVKSEGREHLVRALHGVAHGRPYIAPRMAESLRRGNALGRIGLSQREREVLVAWFGTESKDDAGKLLNISPTTVRTHLQRVRAKYARNGRPAPTKSVLVALAIEDGIIGVSDLSAVRPDYAQAADHA